MKLSDDLAAGKEPRRNLENARRTVAELTARLETRKAELAAQRNVISRRRLVLGGRSSSPGLLRKRGGRNQAFRADARPARGRAHRHGGGDGAERGLGYEVVDVSAEKCGWDLTAHPPAQDGRLPDRATSRSRGGPRGRPPSPSPATRSLYALNQEKFFLAIVLVDGETVEAPTTCATRSCRSRTGGCAQRQLRSRRFAGRRRKRNTPMTDTVDTPQQAHRSRPAAGCHQAACAREKSIRHGHPCTLHLWWARRPLAAARAVIFAQLVNDPGWRAGRPTLRPRTEGGQAEGAQAAVQDHRGAGAVGEHHQREGAGKRPRGDPPNLARDLRAEQGPPQAAELFDPEKLPAFHDPFAGGGSIPLEAQRLGLEAMPRDLNPVAVLINKAMIEIPPKFAGRPPVGPVRGERQPRNARRTGRVPRSGRRCALLRRVDARGGPEAHRPPLPAGRVTAEMAGPAGPQAVVGRSP